MMHVLQGSPEPHWTILREKASSSSRLSDWTVPKSARTGDRVVFYVVGPLSSFVATGIVAENPWKDDKRNSYWYGRYMAAVRNLTLLPRLVPLALVREALPRWRYLKSAQGTVTVPEEFAPLLLR